MEKNRNSLSKVSVILASNSVSLVTDRLKHQKAQICQFMMKVAPYKEDDLLNTKGPH